MAFPEVYMPSGYGLFTMTFDNNDSNFNAVVTMGFRNIANLTAAAANTALRNIWASTGRPVSATIRSDQWTWVSSYVLIQGPVYQTSDDFAANVPGTGAFGCVPASNSVVVNKKTPYAGRSMRGRFSWPPFQVDEELVDAGGRIDQDQVAIMQTGFTGAIQAMETQSLPMVLLHTRKTADVEPTPTLVSSLTVQPLMGSQRKRMRR